MGSVERLWLGLHYCKMALSEALWGCYFVMIKLVCGLSQQQPVFRGDIFRNKLSYDLVAVRA